MRGNLRPIRLVQVLADVNRVRVVGAVPLDGDRPVVGGPENVDAGIPGAGAPSAEAGEQVDCCGHEEVPSVYSSTKEEGDSWIELL